MVTHTLNQRCFALASTWLLSLADQHELTLNDLFRILLGVWICERVSPNLEQCPKPEKVITLVDKRLQDEFAAGRFDTSHYDFKLLLFCQHILSKEGRRVEGIAAVAAQVAEALQSLPMIPLRYAGESILLYQLGYGKRPTFPPLMIEEASGGPLGLLRSGEDRVRSVCNNVSAATGFGQRRLKTDPDVCKYLERILPIILLQSFRDYRLETGAILLRTLRYMRVPRNKTLRLAIEFLIDQQRSDGRFGYFAIETDEISSLENHQEFDSIRQLYLPITLSCLWALAETAVPGFRLFMLPKSN